MGVCVFLNARLQANWGPTSRWLRLGILGGGESSELAQEPGPEHELRGLLDQRSLAEDPLVIQLARLVPEHFVAHVGVRRAAGGQHLVGLGRRGPCIQSLS